MLVVPSWKGVWLSSFFLKNQAFLWLLKPVRDGPREPGAVVADVLGWTSGHLDLSSSSATATLCNLK